MDWVKKDGILVEAGRCFSRFGFKKTSVDEIAKHAGVGKGTVYLAASSKEDLYYQVLNREVRAWIAASAKVIDRRPADVILADSLAVGIAYLDGSPLLMDLLVGGAQQLLPAWRDELEELRALGRANLVEILRLGVRQGLFRADLDVDVVAALLQDFHLASYVLRSHEKPGDIAARARAGLDLVLNGLRVRPAASPPPRLD
jgi:AcrR family transcriptional regulator